MATLIFSPRAWLKLLYMKNSADTEVSGFGISRIGDPLYVEDFVTIKQECTSVTTDMDEEALEKYFEEKEDEGLPISSFFRIWIHTHPNMAPNPSSVDESNFSTMFKSCTWALMVIIGKNEEVYARLRLNKVDVVGKLEMELDTEVDWVSLYPELQEEWTQELKQNVTKKVWQSSVNNGWRPGQPWQGNQSVYYNQSAYGNQSFTARTGQPISEYDEANEAILEELNQEQNQTNVRPDTRFLKGKLKKIIDRLDDFDKSILIDEIDEFYDLNYLTGAAMGGTVDSEDFSVDEFTGKEER